MQIYVTQFILLQQYILFCFTCADDPTNSAGSFEMVENFDDGIVKKDIFEQENDLDIKKEPYNGK